MGSTGSFIEILLQQLLSPSIYYAKGNAKPKAASETEKRNGEPNRPLIEIKRRTENGGLFGKRLFS